MAQLSNNRARPSHVHKTCQHLLHFTNYSDVGSEIIELASDFITSLMVFKITYWFVFFIQKQILLWKCILLLADSLSFAWEIKLFKKLWVGKVRATNIMSLARGMMWANSSSARRTASHWTPSLLTPSLIPITGCLLISSLYEANCRIPQWWSMNKLAKLRQLFYIQLAQTRQLQIVIPIKLWGA